jgi:hypothetical protein
MVSKLDGKDGAAQIETWLKDMGSRPIKVPAANTNWQYEIEYPAGTPHRLVVANPTPVPRALVVAAKVVFSPEHLECFGTFENDEKQAFLGQLHGTLNREFVEFQFEGAATGLSCPTAFTVTAMRFDDGLSLDSLARTVSSVYKTQLAGIMCVQQILQRNFPPGGGDFPFNMPRLQ